MTHHHSPPPASTQPVPEITVVAGVIRGADGRICLSRRPPHKHQGGLWEFPGGKVEPGESLHEALVRELNEELGLAVTSSQPFMTVEHRYPDLRVVLHFREVSAWQGDPHGREGQPVEWVPLADIAERAFPAANRSVALALHLPPELVIIPEGLTATAVLQGLERLDVRRQGVYLRSYSQSPMLAQLAACCRQRGLRFWIRDDAALARREKAFGLHLTSSSLTRLDAAPEFDGVLSAACHDGEQIDRALALGCRMATLSPVAATASHPDAEPLGWDGFHRQVREKPLVFYALGGVTPEQVLRAREHGGFGVAGIRAFWPQS